jgi:hypothetical protein
MAGHYGLAWTDWHGRSHRVGGLRTRAAAENLAARLLTALDVVSWQIVGDDNE